MAKPLIETEQYLKNNPKLSKLEFLPIPAIFSDVQLNANMELIHRQLQELWSLVGVRRLEGLHIDSMKRELVPKFDDKAFYDNPDIINYPYSPAYSPLLARGHIDLPEGDMKDGDSFVVRRRISNAKRRKQTGFVGAKSTREDVFDALNEAKQVEQFDIIEFSDDVLDVTKSTIEIIFPVLEEVSTKSTTDIIIPITEAAFGEKDIWKSNQSIVRKCRISTKASNKIKLTLMREFLQGSGPGKFYDFVFGDWITVSNQELSGLQDDYSLPHIIPAEFGEDSRRLYITACSRYGPEGPELCRWHDFFYEPDHSNFEIINQVSTSGFDFQIIKAMRTLTEARFEIIEAENMFATNSSEGFSLELKNVKGLGFPSEDHISKKKPPGIIEELRFVFREGVREGFLTPLGNVLSIESLATTAVSGKYYSELDPNVSGKWIYRPTRWGMLHPDENLIPIEGSAVSKLGARYRASLGRFIVLSWCGRRFPWGNNEWAAGSRLIERVSPQTAWGSDEDYTWDDVKKMDAATALVPHRRQNLADFGYYTTLENISFKASVDLSKYKDIKDGDYIYLRFDKDDVLGDLHLGQKIIFSLSDEKTPFSILNNVITITIYPSMTLDELKQQIYIASLVAQQKLYNELKTHDDSSGNDNRILVNTETIFKLEQGEIVIVHDTLLDKPGLRIETKGDAIKVASIKRGGGDKPVLKIVSLYDNLNKEDIKLVLPNQDYKHGQVTRRTMRKRPIVRVSPGRCVVGSYIVEFSTYKDFEFGTDALKDLDLELKVRIKLERKTDAKSTALRLPGVGDVQGANQYQWSAKMVLEPLGTRPAEEEGISYIEGVLATINKYGEAVKVNFMTPNLLSLGLVKSDFVFQACKDMSGKAQNQFKKIYDSIALLEQTNSSRITANEESLRSNSESIRVHGASIIANTATTTRNRTDIDANLDEINKNANNINTNRDNIDTNRDNITANRDNITVNRTDITANRTDITANRNDITANRDNITANRDNITVNRTDITANRNDITANRNDIARTYMSLTSQGRLHLRLAARVSALEQSEESIRREQRRLMDSQKRHLAGERALVELFQRIKNDSFDEDDRTVEEIFEGLRDRHLLNIPS